MKVLNIDQSGTGTTGMFLINVEKNKIISYQFSSFKHANWEEHIQFLINAIRELEPDIVVYENTTYIYGRQHQGTVGLYKLTGAIASLKYFLSHIKIESIAVNQVKGFKKRLFSQTEKIEGLTCKEGRGKGWKYNDKKINLHQLDALIIYHLWSKGSLESQKKIKEKIFCLKAKKSLGIRQKEQLKKLEKFLVEREKIKEISKINY